MRAAASAALDDRMRGDVIERLMCDFSVAFSPMRQRYGSHFDAVYSDALEVAALDQEDWCGVDGERFYITPEGKPFTRIIASKFDAWLNKGNVRYSKAV